MTDTPHIVVLGPNGMQGSMLCKVGQERGLSIHGIARDEWDAIRDPVIDLKHRIPYSGPVWIVNCIGAIPQKSYTDTVADELNSLLPHSLGDFCKEYGHRYIHLSTNCVFSGEVGHCDEKQFPDATDLYGRSKADGEPFYGVVLRCSIVGPEVPTSPGYGLFGWFAKAEGHVQGYTDHLWNGLTTREMANVILDCCCEGVEDGLYHVYSNTTVSKYDLLCAFRDLVAKDIAIQPVAKGTKHYTLTSVRGKEGWWCRKSIYEQLKDLTPDLK